MLAFVLPFLSANILATESLCSEMEWGKDSASVVGEFWSCPALPMTGGKLVVEFYSSEAQHWEVDPS